MIQRPVQGYRNQNVLVIGEAGHMRSMVWFDGKSIPFSELLSIAFPKGEDEVPSERCLRAREVARGKGVGQLLIY